MKTGGNKYFLLLILIISPFLLLCASSPDKGEESSVIRYVNIKAVYEHALNNDKDLIELNKKQNSLIDKKNNSTGDSKAEEITLIEKELADLSIDEDAVKLRIYRKISDVIRDMARRRGIDFIFNRGDAMIYAKTELDITEDVIRELDYRDDKSSPIWK